MVVSRSLCPRAAFKDDDGQPLVEKIRDTAGQKGTGKWTAVTALDLGMPVTLIGEAVFARCLSALQSERIAASKVLPGPAATAFQVDRNEFVEHIRQALYASKIVSYAQGFMLMREAAKEYKWTLNNPSIALMWRGGCIIRRSGGRADAGCFFLHLFFLAHGTRGAPQRLSRQHQGGV